MSDEEKQAFNQLKARVLLPRLLFETQGRPYFGYHQFVIET